MSNEISEVESTDQLTNVALEWILFYLRDQFRMDNVDQNL